MSNKLPPSLLTTLGSVLKEIIFRKQKAYKETMEEDVALLDDSTVLGRRRMAIEVRLGEKEILAMAALQVDGTVADMKSHPERRLEKT